MIVFTHLCIIFLLKRTEQMVVAETATVCLSPQRRRQVVVSTEVKWESCLNQVSHTDHAHLQTHQWIIRWSHQVNIHLHHNTSVFRRMMRLSILHLRGRRGDEWVAADWRRRDWWRGPDHPESWKMRVRVRSERERCGVLQRSKTNLERSSSRVETPLIVSALLRSVQWFEVSGTRSREVERPEMSLACWSEMQLWRKRSVLYLWEGLHHHLVRREGEVWRTPR